MEEPEVPGVTPVFGRSVNPISTWGQIMPTTFLPAPPQNFRPSDSPELRYGSTDLTLIYLLINQNWKCRFRINTEYFLTKIKHRWHSTHRNCHHTKSISKLLLLNSDVKILKFTNSKCLILCHENRYPHRND